MNKNSVSVIFVTVLCTGLGYAYGYSILSLIQTIAAVILTFAIAIYLTFSSTSYSSSELINGLKAVVAGDYGYNFKSKLGTSGEIGEIAIEMDNVIMKVNGMISKMKVSGEQSAYES